MADPVPVDARTLLHLVDAGDLDAAIAAGLMGWTRQSGEGLDEGERTRLMDARQRLQIAWAARERHLARKARLQRRERERRERRAAPTPAPIPAPGAESAPAPALPAAAAAILARARARARAGIAPQ